MMHGLEAVPLTKRQDKNIGSDWDRQEKSIRRQPRLSGFLERQD